MIPFFDFRRQLLSLREELAEAVRRVFSNARFILGEEGRLFEEEFALFTGVRHAVGVGSGTDAITLALMASGVGEGDEVITVSHTAVPTVSAIRAAGARPLFVDIDPGTFTLDPKGLEAAITPRVKAVVPVHLYGHPAEMGPVLEFAARHGLKVVEDCAQAHGATVGGRGVGTLGDFGCFSFYPTKNLGAYGDAGAVVTGDGALADRLRRLRNYGQSDRYHCRIEGRNSRLDEIQAAFLRVKLKHLGRWNERRRALARLYGGLLRESGVGLPVERPWARHVYHLYVIRSKRRDALRGHLEKRGVGTLIHYPVPAHLQEGFSFLGVGEGALPETERAATEVLSLPLYPELEEEEVRAVAAAVKEFGSGGRG